MSKINSTAAMLALVALLGAPAAAAEQPRAQTLRPAEAAPPVASEGTMTAERHRRYRGRRNRGVDVGDVLTGILILGGIAAITNAARDAERDAERERQERRRDRDYGYDYGREDDYDRDYADRDYADRRDADRYARSVSPAQAAEACLEEVEQLGAADDIDLVRRAGDGWRVEGRMADGTPYSCAVDADGRVREIGRAGSDPYTASGAAQDDYDYAAARERQGGYAYRASDTAISIDIDDDVATDEG